MKNILLEKYLEVTGGSELQRWFTHPDVHDVHGIVNAFTVRDACTHRYSWAVPNQAAIETLLKYSPIVEIGAGTGYWASLVADGGGDIIAYDQHPPSLGSEQNPYHQNQKTHFLVKKGSYTKAALHPNRALFLCWPPYESELAFQALRAYTGNTLIFVGEGDGGCTGNAEFFETLQNEWVIEEKIAIPQWYGIHDHMTVYSKVIL